MTETADIVIIGGGIVGTSIAYHLARRGAGRGVVLLERNTLASGTTAAAAGGIRSQFSTEINIRMSLLSVPFWRQAEELLGTPVGYHEHGYLYLAGTDAERASLEQSVALQNRLGVPSRLLSPTEAERLVPGLNVSDIQIASYSAEDGGAIPSDATNGYAARAREGGVTIRQGVEVIGILKDGDRIAGVETNQGRIATPVVVNAAGPWARLVGALAGVAIPVLPYRREIYVSEPFPRDRIGEIPLVIDLQRGWYFRRDGAGILMSGMRDSTPGYDIFVNRADFPIVARTAVHRMPLLAEAEFGKKAWAGLYDVSPDDHAILGATPVDGFYLACGFSGHGFQHSPATGQLLAELLLDGRTSLDISPLSLDRFATGALLREPLTAHAGALPTVEGSGRET